MSEKKPEVIYYESSDGKWRVRKDWFGEPRIVYPLKTKYTDGSEKINLKALLIGGSWNNFISYIFFILIILGLLLSFNHDLKAGYTCINNISFWFGSYTLYRIFMISRDL
jgi:hypothetical protein